MKIVVLAGGLSTERDVSLITSVQVCKALKERGHKAIVLDVFLGYPAEDYKDVFEKGTGINENTVKIEKVDPDTSKVKASRGGNPDCFLGPNIIEICRMADIVYMGLHGADGENGKIQATFDILGIKYTGSGYLGSAIAMDKGMAKKVFLTSGIPTPAGFSVTPDSIKEVPEEIGFPCVVKPCCGGSSVGVSIPKDAAEYHEALQLAFKYENEILVEKYIKGREFSVGVIAGKSLPIIEIVPKEGFYDYETKYQAGMANDICPAPLTEEQTQAMQAYAVDVYRELKLDIYARIDFLLDEEENMYCLEANTLPGMTPTSLLPQEAKVLGISYGELCETMIAETMKHYGMPVDDEKKKINNSRNQKYTRGDLLSTPRAMKKMTLEKIAEVCGGTYFGPEEGKNKEVTSIVIDSRQVTAGGLFVAIKGNRVDGNKFIPSCYEKGVLGCMSEDAPEDAGKPFVQVASCEQALKDMAAFYRSVFDGKLIGITGSVGKTTTKEIIASVLSEKYITLKTLGNFNNEIGLPLTIFRLRPQHEVAVIEMGISHFGDMTHLAKIATPDACVITNIGQCHLENLGTRDGILKAKTEVFDYLTGDKKVYLNGNDDKLATLTADTRIDHPVYFGRSDMGRYYAENVQDLGLEGTKMDLVTPQGTISVTIPLPGKHMIGNALAAAAIATDLGLSLEQIKAGIEKLQPVDGRSNIIHTEKYTIMDDCYNANPASMKAGIDILSSVSGRTVAILGDMFELGENEKKLHYGVGEYAAEKRIGELVCVGNLAKEIAAGANSKNTSTHVTSFATREDAQAHFEELLKPGDAILVKASHAMEFEKIVANLKNL